MKKINASCAKTYNERQKSGRCENHFNKFPNRSIIPLFKKYIKGSTQKQKKKHLKEIIKCNLNTSLNQRDFVKCVKKHAKSVSTHHYDKFQDRLFKTVKKPILEHIKPATSCMFKGYNAIKKLKCDKKLPVIPYK